MIQSRSYAPIQVDIKTKNITLSTNVLPIKESFMKKFSVIILTFLSLLITSNEATINKKYVCMETIRTMCKSMHTKITDNESPWHPECIIGLSRGGLIPLGLLAGEAMFNNRNVRIISITSYSDEQHQSDLRLVFPLSDAELEQLNQFKSILVVDDIADSGKTFAWVTNMLKNEIPDADIKTAALFYKPASSLFKPDYYVETTDSWIVFPWDD